MTFTDVITHKMKGWEFNHEVAPRFGDKLQGEITTAFYANYDNAYIPHSPSDYTLTPYQWYDAASNSQSSTAQSGEATTPNLSNTAEKEVTPTTNYHFIRVRVKNN